MTGPNPFSFRRSDLQFVMGSRQAIVKPTLVKAGAEAVVDEARFRMTELVHRLQRHEIDIDVFYLETKRQVKLLHTAQAALARGGWDQMRPADYARVADEVGRQFGFLRERVEVAAKGAYGPDYTRRGFEAHIGQYADAGRSTYENTRLQVLKEGGAVEAQRIRAATDGCEDCIAWADLGWIPIEDMESNYPIGSGACRNNCHCVIVTRRDTSREFVSLQ